MTRSPADAHVKLPISPASKMRVFGTKPFMRFARKFNASTKTCGRALKKKPTRILVGMFSSSP
jgi:hypothetical protein